LNRRRIRVLALDPVAGTTGSIARAETLRHDALESQRASVPEDDIAGLGNVLVQLQSGLKTKSAAPRPAIFWIQPLE
jgi:hypothetical protein